MSSLLNATTFRPVIRLQAQGKQPSEGSDTLRWGRPIANTPVWRAVKRQSCRTSVPTSVSRRTGELNRHWSTLGQRINKTTAILKKRRNKSICFCKWSRLAANFRPVFGLVCWRLLELLFNIQQRSTSKNKLPRFLHFISCISSGLSMKTLIHTEELDYLYSKGMNVEPVQEQTCSSYF